ncbi:type 2 lanthipeptide synthetase LanM family protein [Gracilibacillus thailandensis]|uniref:Type 2 lantipeptide synthetase LanM n=1 Tax=Gracilibacillus thailandensis TaxID=563735 RepID=A0A6N7R0V6_9BACI|nr:type 2 lanthipeptide synthetase LanM family protein [Gracilibacillus thailandensis]MRI65899.1 type 2 lantipeptide synthetase LanM [Gracilibacillus thailandensis]
MGNLTAILNIEEKLRDQSKDLSGGLLDRNIKITYKDNMELFEDSIANILNIHSKKELTELYKSSAVKNDARLILNKYRAFKNRLITAPYTKYSDKENVLFINFASKVSSIAIQDIKNRNVFKNNKFILVNEQQFLEHISFQVQSAILKTCYRTLVLDFNVCLEKNQLIGETKEEKYRYYNEYFLGDSTYLNHFFELYPGILRILHNEVRKIVKITTDIVKHYVEDMESINFFKSKQPYRIETIILGLGDSHSDGRRVAKIILENNYKLIYKPRDLHIDQMYREICEYINQLVDSQFYIRTPKVYQGKDHGWAEYIDYKECSSEEEIANFYKRMGAQLALLYTLNAIDFHSENLIAHGSFPVLIDLESLFHMPYQEKNVSDAYNKTKEKLSTSVKSIGLLPFIFGSNHTDVSGIGQKGEVNTFIKVPKIKLDEDTVKIEREYGKMNASLNHPKINGQYVEANHYIEEIKQGFTEIYKLIQNNKKEIENIIHMSADKVRVRFIPKPTVRYASLLELSLHPRFLHNYIDREVFLAKIWEDAISNEWYEKIARHEFQDLTNGDIPLFSLSIKSCDLFSSTKEKIKNYFNKTPFEVVQQKLNKMDSADLDFQKKLIDLSIQSINHNILHNPTPKEEKDYSHTFIHTDFFIEKAKEIEEVIKSQAIVGHNMEKRNYSWVNSTPIGVKELHWSHAPMGDTLYNGLSGMAMMYLSLWIVTKRAAYLNIGLEIVEDLLNRILDWKEVNKNEMIPIGAFTGASSYIYLLMNYFVATKEVRFKKAACELATRLPQLIKKDKEFDIISGVAGTIVVLVSSYELEKERIFINIAEKCADHLLENLIVNDDGSIAWIGVSEVPLTGFSHGNAGNIYALAVLNKHLKRKDIDSVISKGLQFENSQMMENGWLDNRMDNSVVTAASWCHGAPGILLSRLELAQYNNQEVAIQSKKDLQYAIDNILEDGFGREHSLCHGDIGNAMILINCGRSMDNQHYINIGKNLLYESILRGETDGYKCGVGNGIESPNLMIGLAGVVYGLMYASDDRIPLLLDLKIGTKIADKGAYHV